jgi:hypothetical protein
MGTVESFSINLRYAPTQYSKLLLEAGTDEAGRGCLAGTSYRRRCNSSCLF